MWTQNELVKEGYEDKSFRLMLKVVHMGNQRQWREGGLFIGMFIDVWVFV
jgi:hypothetical protein